MVVRTPFGIVDCSVALYSPRAPVHRVVVLERHCVCFNVPDDEEAVVGAGHEQVGEGGVRLENVHLVLVTHQPLQQGLGIRIPHTKGRVRDCCDHLAIIANPVHLCHPQWLFNVFLLVKSYTSSVPGGHPENCRVPGSCLETPQSRRPVLAPRDEPKTRFVRPLDRVNSLRVRLLLQHLDWPVLALH